MKYFLIFILTSVYFNASSQVSQRQTIDSTFHENGTVKSILTINRTVKHCFLADANCKHKETHFFYLVSGEIEKIIKRKVIIVYGGQISSKEIIFNFTYINGKMEKEKVKYINNDLLTKAINHSAVSA